jgi:hypothetical protein
MVISTYQFYLGIRDTPPGLKQSGKKPLNHCSQKLGKFDWQPYRRHRYSSARLIFVSAINSRTPGQLTSSGL